MKGLKYMRRIENYPSLFSFVPYDKITVIINKRKGYNDILVRELIIVIFLL